MKSETPTADESYQAKYVIKRDKKACEMRIGAIENRLMRLADG